MTTFRYEALDADGGATRGHIEGDSPRQARERLRERGLTPLAVEHVDRGPEGAVRGPRWSVAERALVLRQLATLLGAGLTLDEALSALGEQADSRKLETVIASLRAQVREGGDLAGALRRHPRAFPPEVAAAVAAGEETGALDTVFARLADFTERRQGLGREVGLALIYPAVVVVVALVVVAALMIWVVPRVVGVFEHAGRELPWLTRALIAASEAISAHWAWWLAGGAVLALAGVRALRTARGRAVLEAAAVRLPLLGPALTAGAAARLCRSLALQVASGVPLVPALRSSADAPGRVALGAAVRDAAEAVREGGTLAAALGERSVLPPVALRLVASGERSGRLAEMLDHAAATLEREAAQRAAAFSALMQPLLILLVGGFVLLVVLAVMLPILNLNQLIA